MDMRPAWLIFVCIVICNVEIVAGEDEKLESLIRDGIEKKALRFTRSAVHFVNILRPKNNSLHVTNSFVPKVEFAVPYPWEKARAELHPVTKVCFGLTRETTTAYKAETIVNCTTISSFTNITELQSVVDDINTAHIELTIRAAYVFRIMLFYKDYDMYSYADSRFEFGTSKTCLSNIQNRYNAVTTVTKYNKNWYEDGTVLAYMSPLCSDEYDDKSFSMLATNSAFRGSFGVDSLTSMEFGHGDLMMLNFVLVKHPRLKNIVELGTFAGITSFHWGVAAGLRGGVFNSFDITDHRLEPVKKLWDLQPHMKFHLADVMQFEKENGVMDSVLKYHVERECDLLFVDAAHHGKSRLYQAMVYGKLMKKVGSIIFVHDFPGHVSLPEWIQSLATIGFIYRYHDLSGKTTSSVGIFEKIVVVVNNDTSTTNSVINEVRKQFCAESAKFIASGCEEYK